MICSVSPEREKRYSREWFALSETIASITPAEECWWMEKVKDRNYELYGENLLRAMNRKKRDVSPGKEKAQGNREKLVKKENSI